ncbi:HNH endonuclease [Erysipelothrix anatis]|uniref:HNH endonuclease n=1 Tax=Erysipelothrix anatis TaxID=2683713 RepID=UPI001915A73A|nr:hypothetical protein [Erysipelothrix anatis]
MKLILTIMVKQKKRRARRKPAKDWIVEINKGNVDAFYKSTDWDIARESALIRDKGVCQWFLGKFKHEVTPDHISLVTATTVHHIKPLREYPELALDVSNLVSLSFEAHERIEGRWRDNFKKKKVITEERW